MKIWINACEVSGDLQASILLKSLQKEYSHLQAIGMGGDELKKAGQENFFHIDELSLMGISEVFSALPRIFKLVRNIKKAIEKERPDALLLVDSGEFNFLFLKFAKKLNIPVYYFIPPKVWAWRKYRVKKLQKYVKKILCILPFELEFYRKYGIEVEYIQNPLVDFLAPYIVKERKIVKQRIALMPGSRKKEALALIPLFRRSAEILAEKYPQMEFYIIKAPNFTQEFLETIWNSSTQAYTQKDRQNSQNLALPPLIEAEDRYTFLSTCEFCLAASGTATFETGLLCIPTIITYKVNRFSYFIAQIAVHIKFAGLVNLILNRLVFPEFIQEEAKAENISSTLQLWIENPEKVEKIQEELCILADKVQQKNTDFKIF